VKDYTTVHERKGYENIYSCRKRFFSSFFAIKTAFSENISILLNKIYAVRIFRLQGESVRAFRSENEKKEE
jgi:hypothetical protein